MTRATREYYDKHVNALWPEKVPPLTLPEATYAAKRFWRAIAGKPLPYKIRVTSGNRNNWVRRGGNRNDVGQREIALWINPSGGWKRLVHDMSHYLHSRYSSGRPHDSSHAYIERRLTQMVIDGNWLSGKLRKPDPPPKPRKDASAVRYQRTLDSIKRWETKLKRAKTALAKLARRRRYYELKGAANVEKETTPV